MRQALCRERYAIFAPFILRFFKTFLIAAGKVNTFAVIRRRYLILLFENPAEMFRRSVSDNPADLTDRNTGRFQKFFSAHHFTVLHNFRKCLSRLPVYQYFWRRKRRYNFYGQIKRKRDFSDQRSGLPKPGRPLLPRLRTASSDRLVLQRVCSGSRRITSSEMPGILLLPHKHPPCWTLHKEHACSAPPHRCQLLPFRNLP